ncbi:MAG: hypothetical protein K2H56_00590 [Malacoplasma sp.]|nr:hypothetical protein [Malacoplasma sp.]MDE7099802.1 hypothetical protein [Malacoplasma sp.]
MNNNIKINVWDLGDFYKVDIKENKETISTGMLIGMVLGFIFFLIIGIILLIIWVTGLNKNTIDVSFNLKKSDWLNQLNKQLQINNLGNNTEYVKHTIIQKIELMK